MAADLPIRRTPKWSWCVRAALLVTLVATSYGAPARASTYVIPHWVETSTSVASSTFAIDDIVYLRYTPGLAGVPSGGGANVDLYLYDNSAGNPLTILSTQVCNPCTFNLGGPTPNATANIGSIIAATTGFVASSYQGYAILAVAGADPSGVTLENDFVNSHTNAFDLDVTSFVPPRLRAEDPAFPDAHVYSLPHLPEKSGTIASTTFTFDEVLYFLYTAGQAGTPAGTGATVDLYLYNESTGALLTNNGMQVCAPCTFNLGGPSPRKLTVTLESLILARGGSFDASVKLASGVVVVGGADPGNVTVQGWLVNSHSSAFDLATTVQTAQPVGSPATSTVIPSDQPGRVQSLIAAPNPSVHDVSLRFELASAGEIELAIFDVAGRRVATVYQGRGEAGTHDLHWNGLDANAKPVDGGIYFARLKGTDRSTVSRVVMMR